MSEEVVVDQNVGQAEEVVVTPVTEAPIEAPAAEVAA